jgi:hypothetical protein
MTARCWRLIAAVAALVHAPAARWAMLRKRLRGDPFMLVLLSAVNGCRGDPFRRKIDAPRTHEDWALIAKP